MDVLQIIKPKIKPLKASYDKLTLWHKLTILTIIGSLLGLAVPHETLASENNNQTTQLVFVLNDHLEFLNHAQADAQKRYREMELKKALEQKQRLAQELKKYLGSYNSPLAEAAPTLVNLKNWKKIVALAAAESSLCRKYPVGTANCWGVGGSELWDFGSNLDDGVMAMNKFLETHPKRSKVKYSQMSFERMNGLYKQPAQEHWLTNNQAVYNDLVGIEKSL